MASATHADGLVLLERGLGVRVDAVRQVDDLVARVLDRGGGAGLEVGERLGGTGGGDGVGHGRHRIGRRGHVARLAVPSASLRGERQLGDDEDRREEQHDRRLERVDEPEHDERRRRTGRPSRRAVAARNQSPW